MQCKKFHLRYVLYVIHIIVNVWSRVGSLPGLGDE